jgi:hypothetical protein
MKKSIDKIAIAYIARGADYNWSSKIERFINSYKNNPAGVSHCLYVIFKGFESNADLEKAAFVFCTVPHKPIFLEDDNLDVGAYISWANMIEEDYICAFNTASEIVAPYWLKKLYINLGLRNVGLVGATSSYESLKSYNPTFPRFPNIHIRSSAFMINRKLFLSLVGHLKITEKHDAYNFESGRNSLTQKVLASGKQILLVGKNGRGYEPELWPLSNTFRMGKQENLLVTDNQTRDYMDAPWTTKKQFTDITWGKYIKTGETLSRKVK